MIYLVGGFSQKSLTSMHCLVVPVARILVDQLRLYLIHWNLFHFVLLDIHLRQHYNWLKYEPVLSFEFLGNFIIIVFVCLIYTHRYFCQNKIFPQCNTSSNLQSSCNQIKSKTAIINNSVFPLISLCVVVDCLLLVARILHTKPQAPKEVKILFYELN